jgi:hypothetical protein
MSVYFDMLQPLQTMNAVLDFDLNKANPRERFAAAVLSQH